MPVQTRVKNYTHIKVTGTPPLSAESSSATSTQGMPRTVKVPDSRLQNEEAIQVSLMEVVNGLIRGTIELKRGELILRALNIAVRNIRCVKFDLHPEKMVRDVPPDPAPPEPKPTPAPAHESTASEAAAYRAAVARPVHVGTQVRTAQPNRVGTHAFVRPAAQKYPGRSAVAPSPTVKSPPARQAGVESPTIDPTRRKPPLGVKEVAAPKERKIAAHRVSGEPAHQRRTSPEGAKEKCHEDGCFRMTKSKSPPSRKKRGKGGAPSVVKLQSEVENLKSVCRGRSRPAR